MAGGMVVSLFSDASLGCQGGGAERVRSGGGGWIGCTEARQGGWAGVGDERCSGRSGCCQMPGTQFRMW